MAGWQAGWLAGRLADWLTGWLTGWHHITHPPSTPEVPIYLPVCACAEYLLPFPSRPAHRPASPLPLPAPLRPSPPRPSPPAVPAPPSARGVLWSAACIRAGNRGVLYRIVSHAPTSRTSYTRGEAKTSTPISLHCRAAALPRDEAEAVYRPSVHPDCAALSWVGLRCVALLCTALRARLVCPVSYPSYPSCPSQHRDRYRSVMRGYAWLCVVNARKPVSHYLPTHPPP